MTAAAVMLIDAWAPTPGQAQTATASPATTRGTVLVVDDEADIVTSLSQLIEDEVPGVHVIGVQSGRQALEVLENQDVDVIVTDFRMPGMDGLMLLAAVRKRWPDVPAIMVTAYQDALLARKATQDGHAMLCLPKPVPEDRLVGAVDALLAPR